MVVFCFVLSVEPYKYEALNTLLNLGRSIITKGHEIRGIFLFGSGVQSMKRDVSLGKSKTNLQLELEQFCEENKINIAGCSTWISYSGLKEDAFIKGACQVGLPELTDWILESDRLIVFGQGG
jgi:sulfur relay (sulfurtransferase) complex TusBCD TusD component (DsrE family)